MNDVRGEELLMAILRISRMDPQGMGRDKALVRAANIAALELVRRRQDEAPSLPFSEPELFEFLDWVEKEKLLVRGGEFQTAWEIYRRKHHAAERV